MKPDQLLNKIGNAVCAVIALLLAFSLGAVGVKVGLNLFGINSGAIIRFIESVANWTFMLNLAIFTVLLVACGLQDVFDWAKKNLSTKADRSIFADKLRREWSQDF